MADLGLRFFRSYHQVLDLSRGVTDPDWFVGGQLNIADACLTRWAEDPQARDRTAVVHEAEDGTVDTLTFAELENRVRRVAAGLRALGIGRGDAVALYLPMIGEAVVALYAAARLGAVLVPLFSGFAPGAIASRLADGEVRAVVVAESTVRRGRTVAMLPPIREAVAGPSSRRTRSSRSGVARWVGRRWASTSTSSTRRVSPSAARSVSSSVVSPGPP